MNKIILIGRLTKDPVMSMFGEKAKASFNLAVDRSYKKNGQKLTDFFRIDAWGKTAELIGDYCDKGKQVMVEGEFYADEYTDKDGEKKKKHYVNCKNIEFLGSKSDGAPSQRKSVEDDIRLNEVDETDIDQELERNQPYGF